MLVQCLGLAAARSCLLRAARPWRRPRRLWLRLRRSCATKRRTWEGRGSQARDDTATAGRLPGGVPGVRCQRQQSVQ